VLGFAIGKSLALLNKRSDEREKQKPSNA